MLVSGKPGSRGTLLFFIQFKHCIRELTILPVNVKRWLDRYLFSTTLSALQVHKPARGTRAGVDYSHPLRAESVIACATEKMSHARCRVDQRDAPALWHETPGRGKNVRQGGHEFMASDGFLRVRIYSAAACLPVRGITQDKVEALRRQMAVSFPEINLAYFNPVGQCIFLHAPIGEEGEFMLDFDPNDFVLCFVPVGKHQSDYSTACAELYYSILSPNVGQAGKEHGIHGKTVAFFFLEYSQTTIEQRVAGDYGRSFYQAISSQGERGFITRPLITFG